MIVQSGVHGGLGFLRYEAVFAGDMQHQRVGNGVAPSLANVFNLAAHAHAVNFACGGQCAHHHRDVELAALAVTQGEQLGLGV